MKAGSGAGRVLLSLVHFDTPGDRNGATVLGNIWNYLGADDGKQDNSPVIGDEKQPVPAGVHRAAAMETTSLGAAEASVADLIDLGRRNFLWYWRNPLLLQWRRGVRGLEYCTLSVMLKELAELAALPGRTLDLSVQDSRLDLVREFSEKAKGLLVRERIAMQNAHITYEHCDDQAIQALREELFSRSKSHGGLFKKVIDGIDQLVYNALSGSTIRHEKREGP